MSRAKGITLYELVLFPILGVLMFVSKLFMEFLPNIHLLGMFIMVFTLVFRWKALIPIYIYVAAVGIYMGFSPWWLFNLYTWAVLWLITLVLPRNMPRWLSAVVYPAVCALHGLCYGVLCAPMQALLFHLNWEGTLTWIASGFTFDVIHGVGNLFTGMLVIPFVELFHRLNRRFNRSW